MKFAASRQPEEGLGALLLFRLIEDATPAFFHPGRRIVLTRAPGRLAVLGGPGSRRGGACVQWPIAEAACVALQARDDEMVRLWSPSKHAQRSQRIATRLADLGVGGPAAADYGDLRNFLCADPQDRWSAHLLSALAVLSRECGLRPTHGFDLLLQSDVPERCGAASSTAVTVAVLCALGELFGVALDLPSCARLATLAAREVCLDQDGHAPALAVVGAAAGRLHEVAADGGVLDYALPGSLEWVGMATGASGQSDATDESAGSRALAEARVQQFRELCQAGSPEALLGLGELLFAEHAALRDSRASHERADQLVALARARRAAGGKLLGATATAGGGTVLLLGEHGKVWLEALRLKKELLQRTGHSAHIFRWSSMGAAHFPPIVLQPTES